MSDDQKDEGLPTAAYRVTAQRTHLDSDIEVVKKSKPQHHREDIDQVDELVRRADVALRIEDIIQDFHDMEERQSNSLKLQGYREARRLLEKLFDEVQK